MSWSPSPPGRLESNNSVRPLRDRFGRTSFDVVFTGNPMFSGMDHGSWMVGRVETQMSPLPDPPGRSDQKKISFPSVRTLGAGSLEVEFTSVTGTAVPRVLPLRVSGATQMS